MSSGECASPASLKRKTSSCCRGFLTNSNKVATSVSTLGLSCTLASNSARRPDDKDTSTGLRRFFFLDWPATKRLTRPCFPSMTRSETGINFRQRRCHWNALDKPCNVAPSANFCMSLRKARSGSKNLLVILWCRDEVDAALYMLKHSCAQALALVRSWWAMPHNFQGNVVQQAILVNSTALR